MGKPAFIPTEETGRIILQWCNEGAELILPSKEETLERINDCKTIGELLMLYNSTPAIAAEYKAAFSDKRAELEKQPPTISNTKIINNGTYSNK
jgi:hypothetical protein